MKKGVEYRDVAKEIVDLLAKYEATVKDVRYILGWLDDEMRVQPVQESADSLYFGRKSPISASAVL